MFDFVALLFLVGGLFVFASIYALVLSFSNRKRLNLLEREVLRNTHRLETLSQRGVSPPAPDVVVEKKIEKKYEPQVLREKEQSPWAETPNEGAYLGWLRENWLLAIGGMFMLFAAGWLARYSIMNDLIGPVGRIILGLVLGTGLIGFAERRIRTHLDQGGFFAILGSTIVILTIFAGRYYYDMFSPAMSMGLMFMAVSLTSVFGVKYQAPRLTYAALVMAGIVPLLVSTGNKNFIGLFSYLSVVTAGTLWVVFLTNWRKNILIALSLVALYSIPVLTSSSYLVWMSSPWVGISFAFGFAFVFFASCFAAALKGSGNKDVSDLVTAGLLGGFLIAWILGGAPEEWQGPFLMGWALLFCASSYHLSMKTKDPSFFYVYGGIGSALLTTALAVLLKGVALDLALIAEASILPFIVWKVLGDERAAIKTSFLMVIPFLSSFSSLDMWKWRTDFYSHVTVTFAMTIASLGVMYFICKLKKNRPALEDDVKIATLFNVSAATLYGGFFIWNTLHVAWVHYETATILSLVIFMLFGLGSYVFGYLQDKKSIKVYGGLVVGWVSLRLIFIDMPDMQAGGKVVTFFILGSLLLGTAFVENSRRKISR